MDLVFDEKQTFLADESSVEPTEGRAVIDIQAEHRRFDYAPGWMAAEGWGADPLASRE